MKLSEVAYYKEEKVLKYITTKMCQCDTDAPAQQPSSTWNKHFARTEIEKRPLLP